jgi:hypothetical protein
MDWLLKERKILVDTMVPSFWRHKPCLYITVSSWTDLLLDYISYPYSSSSGKVLSYLIVRIYMVNVMRRKVDTWLQLKLLLAMPHIVW